MCDAGGEQPGCYTGDITRDPAAVARTDGAKPAAKGKLSTRPAGSVVSVNTATYTCRNGECAILAPLFVHHEE